MSIQTTKLISGNKSTINNLDGACCLDSISDIFASKYEALFQSTPTDVRALDDLYSPTIQVGVENDDRYFSSITVNDVVEGLKDINLGNHDGNLGLTSDHLVNSSMKFKVALSILMSCMIVHGHNAGDLHWRLR